MTSDPTLWRLYRRFALDARVHSDLARRIFPLFLTDWALHGAAGVPIGVCLADYARVLRSDADPVGTMSVKRAFERLIVVGWLVEGRRHGQQRTFGLGPQAGVSPGSNSGRDSGARRAA